MRYTKFLESIVHWSVLKIDGMIYVYIEIRLVNMSLKNTLQCVSKERENMKFVMIYSQNV